MAAQTGSRAAPRVLVGLVWLVAALCVYAMRQADADLFGYLSYGRLFLERGAATTADPFAYTSQGYRWVPFEYVAQILLWVSYDRFGQLGLILVKCLVGGVAVAFLYGAVRTASDDIVVWAPVFLLSTAVVSRFFLFRPQLFTFAFFALFVWILFRFLLRGRGPLWVLPPAMLLWANLHGGFLAGLGATWLVLLLRMSANLDTPTRRPGVLFESTGPLWATLVACAAASFVNPQGVRLWGYVLTEVLHGTNRQYIAEWGPVSWRGDAWSATALTVIALVLLVLTTRKGVESHFWRVSPRPLIWAGSCLPLVAMAYLSVRHVPLATMWAAPIIAGLATGRTAKPFFQWVWVAFSGVAVAAIALTISYVAANPRPVIATGGSVLGAKHPCRAVGFIVGQGLTGNLYTPLWWGSYITWETYPAIRVSMDGRNISLFPDDMVAENLRFYSGDVTARDVDVPFRYDTDFLLVPTDASVLPMVRADARWRSLFADDDAVLLTREDRGHQSVRSSIETMAIGRAPADCSHVLGRR